MFNITNSYHDHNVYGYNIICIAVNKAAVMAAFKWGLFVCAFIQLAVSLIRRNIFSFVLKMQSRLTTFIFSDPIYTIFIDISYYISSSTALPQINISKKNKNTKQTKTLWNYSAREQLATTFFRRNYPLNISLWSTRCWVQLVGQFCWAHMNGSQEMDTLQEKYYSINIKENI